MTRPKPTKHLARPARRDRGGQLASPHSETVATQPVAAPTVATPPVAAQTPPSQETASDLTDTSVGSETPSPRAPHPQSAAAGLVIADLALHAVRATPAALPDLLLARCEWAQALPPAAARQFAEATARTLRTATPETLRDELADVLARWREQARSFGAT